MQAEQLLREGKLEESLAALQDAVRKDPSDAKHRVFLFQILAVMGQWDRAITQLNVAAEMDPANLLMAEVGRQALNIEALRSKIFSGERLPVVFGEPEEWMSWLVQANQLTGAGKAAEGQELRNRAFEAAPAIDGTIDDTPFAWIADADPRLGPMLEAIVEGRYAWIPFARVRELHIDEPVDLRDLVWATARFVWSNGGESVGLIPTRYPGTETDSDPALRLARKTEWTDAGAELFIGHGQRMFATDAGEYPLLETRCIRLNVAAPEPDVAASAAEGQDG